jgi:NAD(P)-dependent dehydrogenase (short-subunit alcohol dehydrogenase family)
MPEEIAKVVLFLAADAPYATGSIVRVDGGTTAV